MVETASAQGAQGSISVASNAGTSADPQTAATAIIDRNTNPSGLDMEGVRRDLAALAAQDTDFAAEVQTAVEARLTPVQRGQLASASYSIDAPDGGAIAFAEDGITVAEQFASPQGSPSRQQYDRFDRIWGDGNPATNDVASIEQGLRDLSASGLTLAQLEAATGTPAAANENAIDTSTLIADLTQMGIDVVGIVDPTGIADGANAIISLGRAGLALWNGEGSEALGHIGNGALSAVSILPLGDLAKAGKIGKWADTISSAVRAAADSPAVARTVEPLLREIRTNLDRIPQSALDALPSSARESVEQMKTQLDEFFGAGARNADEAIAGGRITANGTLVLDTNRGATFQAGGRTQAIGDTPSVAPRADGRQMVTDVNGEQTIVRRPSQDNYDTRVVNNDGTVTYTREGQSVTYDQNGFPIFEATADLYLSPAAINSRSDRAHFQEANEMMRDALRADPSLAQRLGLNNDQVAFLTRDTPAGSSPPGLTWHHHQDTGRIQLVDRDVHDHFSGGHTGGMRIWGGGR
ncbi:HNH endonuclease [Qipengyuania qiaonensis]|nr:HNH endonuclease [Qipengyuania qiaonensis]